MTEIVKSPTLWSLLLAAVVISGCVTPGPPPPRRVAVAEPPVEQVFVYPNSGQSEAQLDRDRYECHVWAVRQSGFDPSVAHPGYRQRVVINAGPPPGTNTVGGALTGAIIGAAVSRPRNAGGGAIIGALAGAAIGASADSANEQRNERIQQRYDEGSAQVAQRDADYRRAMGACLEGRGYTVK
jgi:Glycine zipper